MAKSASTNQISEENMNPTSEMEPFAFHNQPTSEKQNLSLKNTAQLQHATLCMDPKGLLGSSVPGGTGKEGGGLWGAGEGKVRMQGGKRVETQLPQEYKIVFNLIDLPVNRTTPDAAATDECPRICMKGWSARLVFTRTFVSTVLLPSSRTSNKG